MKKKWIVHIDQNGGEYTGWMTFFAEKVTITGAKTLDVDGYEMEFDEWIQECELAVQFAPGRPDIYSQWGMI